MNFALAPPPPTPVAGFMTGGGRLGTGRTLATFGFNAGPSLKGQLQYIDHAQGLNVHSTALTGYSSLGGTCVTFSGTARVNQQDGFHFTVRQACDNGEPGRGHDTFVISIQELSYSSGYLGTVLTGGPVTTAVCADEADEDPAPFVPVTRTRIVESASA